MAEDVQDKIQRIKDGVQQAEKKQARIEGQLERIQESLKKLGCESIEDGHYLHETTKKKLEKIKKKLIQGVNKWESAYGSLLS